MLLLILIVNLSMTFIRVLCHNVVSNHHLAEKSDIKADKFRLWKILSLAYDLSIKGTQSPV